MKIVAIICNIVLSAFTCFILASEGPPKEPVYIVFSVLMVLIPILSAVVIFRSGAGDKT
jgi:hypothetical protein